MEQAYKIIIILKYLLLILILLAAPADYLKSEETDIDSILKNSLNGSTITGDWGGLRTELEQHGLTVEAVFKQEIWKVASGHKVKFGTSFVDNNDLILTFDFEKMIGWKGSSLVFYTLGNNGDQPNEFVQSVQGISNIAAPRTWKIYSLYYEQQLFNNNFSILIGTYDYNSEFDVKESSKLFINPSHGIGADIAQSGENGPSIFPTTSLGFRLKAKPFGNLYIQAVVLDGIPGDPNNPNGTHIILNKDDGLFTGVEAGYETETETDIPYSKFSVGYWYYTNSYYDIVTGIKNWGIYALIDKAVYSEKIDPEQGLKIFGRFGIADNHINDLDYFIAGGFVYTGLISGREEDRLGLAIASGHCANHYLQEHSGIDDYEHNIELTYAYKISEAVTFQPNFQYIICPGGLSIYDNVLVAGSRLIFNL